MTKRACDKAPVAIGLIDLPSDLWMELLRYAEPPQYGPLARTCSVLMRFMTQPVVVHRLVEYVRRCQLGVFLMDLPTYLFYALPAKFLGSPPHFSWQQYAGGRAAMAEAFPGDAARHDCFFTGGDVAQRLYDKQWEADIDVWTRDATPPKSKQWDFVVETDTEKPLQRCVETFELSVVQQGFLQRASARNEPEFYATPLALYGLRYRRLLISIDPLCHPNYGAEQEDNFNYIRAHWHIQQRTARHSERHHAEFYPEYRHVEQCELCLHNLIESCDRGRVNHEFGIEQVRAYAEPNELMRIIMRQLARIMKYRARFPDFESMYVCNPLTVKKMKLLVEQDRARVRQKQAQCKACQGTTLGPLNQWGLRSPCDQCSDHCNYVHSDFWQ